MLRVRRATPEDYSEICKWWKAQGRAILAWKLLPTLSFLCEDEDGFPIAVCWLYCSDSVVGFVGWFTSNPKANRRKVRDAIRMMDECVAGGARAAGIQMLFQFSGGGGFSRRLLKSGWNDSMVKHDLLLKGL